MQEHFPSASNEAAEKPSVSLTAQEWQTLHMSDDPSTDPEVMAIMAAKNIGFDGGPMDVTVAGAEEGEASRQFVMSTSLEDPFTRDRELSEKAAEGLSSPEQQDEPSVADRLGEVVSTFSEESSREHVLDDASQAHKDQVVSTVDAYAEYIPVFIEKHQKEDELIGELQTKIANQLGPVEEMLSKNVQITPDYVEVIVRQMHKIGQEMDGQIGSVNSKRGLSNAMRQGIAEVKRNVAAKTEEYRAVVSHLTEGVPSTDRNAYQEGTSQTSAEALADMVAIEKDTQLLDEQLRVVGGMAGQYRQALQLEQNRLVELHDTLKKTGRYDPMVLRKTMLQVQAIRQGYNQIGSKVQGLLVLEFTR